MFTFSKNPSKSVVLRLQEQGFTQFSGWLFEKNGDFYDLSAANLDAVNYIVENKLFIVEIE